MPLGRQPSSPGPHEPSVKSTQSSRRACLRDMPATASNAPSFAISGEIMDAVLQVEVREGDEKAETADVWRPQCEFRKSSDHRRRANLNTTTNSRPCISCSGAQYNDRVLKISSTDTKMLTTQRKRKPTLPLQSFEVRKAKVALRSLGTASLSKSNSGLYTVWECLPCLEVAMIRASTHSQTRSRTQMIVRPVIEQKTKLCQHMRHLLLPHCSGWDDRIEIKAALHFCATERKRNVNAWFVRQLLLAHLTASCYVPHVAAGRSTRDPCRRRLLPSVSESDPEILDYKCLSWWRNLLFCCRSNITLIFACLLASRGPLHQRSDQCKLGYCLMRRPVLKVAFPTHVHCMTFKVGS